MRSSSFFFNHPVRTGGSSRSSISLMNSGFAPIIVREAAVVVEGRDADKALLLFLPFEEEGESFVFR
jgi:hypothetical protein